MEKRTSPLTRMDAWVGKVETWLTYAGMVVLVGLMLMVTVEMTGRYLFNKPMLGYIDSMEMMMAVLVFLGISFTQWKGGHIRMELLMDKLQKKGGRPFHAVESLHLLIALIGFSLIAFYTYQNVVNAFTVGDVTAGALIPTWPARMGVLIGSILLCIRLVIQIVQNVTWAVLGVKRAALIGIERSEA
ncbi:MAG: TRAP transporter small permease [Chloroflexota bacterium]